MSIDSADGPTLSGVRRDPVAALNRLLAVTYRALPVYLRGFRPWHRAGNEKLCAQLAQMAADACHYSQRLADAIGELGGCPEPGQYPTEFTSIHDLSLDYLLTRAIDYQRRDIESIRACMEELEGLTRPRALAEEVLGNARGHLETLLELTEEKAV